MKTRSFIVMMIVGLMIIGQGFIGNAFAKGRSAAAGDTTTDATDASAKSAGKPDHGPGHSPTDILSGEAVTITGTITEITAMPGPDEIKINTGSEVISVYGAGPAEYWTELGFTRPVTGDAVTVDGYKVTLSDGSQKIFSAAITIGGNKVQLIDTTTGKPLFQPKGGGPGHGHIDILSGTAVTITGTVNEIAAITHGPDEMKINTGSEVVSVYGIGPAEYWTAQGLTRPVIGDVLTVDGYNVTLPDSSQKIFSAKITIGGIQIQLVDAATGRPLWMKMPNKQM